MLSKVLILLSMIGFGPLVSLAQESPAVLNNYRWENTLLLIFSPTPYNHQYQSQLEILENDTAGLNDRDIKVFHVLENGEGYVEEQSLSAVEAEQLARTYKINPAAFTILLLGKDGTEMLRQSEPLESERLFSVIDALPVRQHEMDESR